MTPFMRSLVMPKRSGTDFKRRSTFSNSHETKKHTPLKAGFGVSSHSDTENLTVSLRELLGASAQLSGRSLHNDEEEEGHAAEDHKVYRRLSSTSQAATASPARGSLNYFQPRSSLLHSKSSRQLMEELTIDKLQVSRLSLYGRSEESKTLQACWERVMNTWQQQQEEGDEDSNGGGTSSQSRDKSSREFVIIHGDSGTGKSALVQRLEKPVERSGGFFAVGKFDFQKRGEPYSGMVSACHDLCLAVTNLSVQGQRQEKRRSWTMEDIAQHIKDQMGSDIEVLTSVLPILRDIWGFDSLPDEPETSSLSKNQGLGMLEERNRFNSAFRRFLRAMSSFGPVVLVLDDLQWIDLASIDLLQYLVQDEENPQLMVIGLYQSNELDEYHRIMTKMIRDIERSADGVSITKIQLGNLSVSNVNELLEDLLLSERVKTQKLAEIVHRKTNGNVFFAIQFLLALQACDLLTYDIGRTCWRWNEENIEDWTAATANVVDLMPGKLNQLDPYISRRLPIVAFLGATFKDRLLSLVLGSFDAIASGDSTESFGRSHTIPVEGADMTEMSNFLEVCKNQGILEAVGEDSHRWIHGKIQEASLSLISEGQQKEWRLMVGRILKQQLSEEEVEENLFLIANLFLDTIGLVPEGNMFRIEAARYFLRAGTKAQATSAFRQAGFYLNKGIELLPGDHWETLYELSLDLYSSAAEAECCVADIDKMETHCHEVLDQKNVPVQDKFRCYLNLVEGLARRNNVASAIEVTMSILEKLGCKFPRKAFHAPTATKRLLSWKGALNNKITEEQISGLGQMIDSKRIFCMHLLEKMDAFCYVSGNMNLFTLVVLMRIEWTIEYGYCLHSASAFSSIGIVYTGALGDIKLGELCSKHCFSLQDKIGNKAIESGNSLRCYGLNLHYTTPLPICQKGLLNGYQVGLEMGDLTSAMFGIYHYLELCRASGESLEVLNEDYLTYVKQMKETHQLQALEWTLVEYQAVLNLIGQSENTVILTGEAMDQEEVLATAEKTKNLTLKYLIRRKQMYLATFLGEHKYGADLALDYGNDALQSLAGSNGAISQCFLSALSCISAYKETKKRKYKVFAHTMTSRIRDWIKKGNPNIGHYGLLLDAEWLALKRGNNESAAGRSFESANRIAARSGFVHDRALINERHAEFLLELGSDNEEVKYRFQEAIKLYTEWGSDRKVEILSAKFDIASRHMGKRHLKQALERLLVGT